MGASHSKKEIKKHQKSTLPCPGCGIKSDFIQPSEISCKWHTPEHEDAIFRKLSAANVEFVTLKHPKSQEEKNKICELVTFLEMLVIPQPVLDPIAVEHADEIKEFFETVELCEKRKEGERILFHGSRLGCEPCAKASQMLSTLKREHFDGFEPYSRLFSLHRPAFPSPSIQFENVENLTLEISEQASAEIKRRLVEHFEIEGINVRPRNNPHGAFTVFEYMKESFSITYFQFNLWSRFPNLKMLTIIDHSFDESANKRENYDLLPHFLIPKSVRVLRVNKNILDTRAYGGSTPFIKNLTEITDLLIDFMPDEVLSVQEPPLLLDRKLKHTVLEVEHMDASALSKLRRLRFTNATLFDQYRERPKYDALNTVMTRFKLPKTLESFELPVTSGMNPFVSYDSKSSRYSSFTQLAENLRCVYPPSLRCIDLSTPFNVATKEVKASSSRDYGSKAAVVVESDEFLNMWEQHEIILDIISAFEVCYFEDVVLHMFRKAFNRKILAPPFKDAEDDSTVKNLTRNLHLLLSGSQFVLPPRFAEHVIKKVHERYAIVIEKSSDRLGMSDTFMVELSKRRSLFTLSSRSNKQTLVQAVDVTFSNKLKRSILTDLMAVKPKYGLHNNHLPRSLEDRSVFAFTCKTPVCELARSAGLLSRVPLEALPQFKCVEDDEYDSDGDSDYECVVGKGCGKEWSAVDARPCRCYCSMDQYGKKRLNPQLAFDLKTFPRLPFSVSDTSVDSYSKKTARHRRDELKDFGFLVELDLTHVSHRKSSSAEGHGSPKSPSKGSPKSPPKSPSKSRKSPESKGGGKSNRRSNISYKVNGTKRVNRNRKHKTKKR
jgi:hypothetical protein